MNTVGLNVFVTVSGVIIRWGCGCGPLFVADLPVFIDFDLALFVYLLYSGGTACPLLIWYTGKSLHWAIIQYYFCVCSCFH